MAADAAGDDPLDDQTFMQDFQHNWAGQEETPQPHEHTHALWKAARRRVPKAAPYA